MTATRIGDWMQTFTGVAYYPGDPRPEDIHILDIAHALSLLCRFGGHCNRFYSVAEHSILVSQVVPPEHALQGLLHDATEAYCMDIPRPLKKQLSNYTEIEQLNWLAVAERFGLNPEIHTSVHEADNNVLLAEKLQLFDVDVKWSVPGTAADVVVIGMDPLTARYSFIQRYFELLRT